VNKVKDLFISHVEKLVLLIFIGGGGIHMFTTLRPTDQSSKKAEIENLVKQIKAKHASSVPPIVDVPRYFDQMRAPFMRVPAIETASSWMWYKIPEVTNTFSIKEGDERELRLIFVKDISKVEIREGKEIVEVKVSPSAVPSLLAKALAPGKAIVIIHSNSGTKETWVIEVRPKVTQRGPENRLAYPPIKINPVVERGAIKVFVLANPENQKSKRALPLVGYKIYRKVGSDGEWTEIYFKKDDQKKDSGNEKPVEGVGEEASIPSLPGLPGAGDAPLETGFIKKKDGPVLGKDEAVPDEAGEPKEQEKNEDWLVYVDAEVKPDTTYIYAASTVSHPMQGEEKLMDEIVETDKNNCISKEIVSKSNLEMQLSGTFNNAASIYVMKYFNDTKFEKKLFNVSVGDTIGTNRRMKVDGELQQVDFSTGALLVDIQEHVRDTTIEKRLIPVKDKDGQIVFKNGRMTRKEISVAVVNEYTKIVVLDTKGRIREFQKK